MSSLSPPFLFNCFCLCWLKSLPVTINTHTHTLGQTSIVPCSHRFKLSLTADTMLSPQPCEVPSSAFLYETWPADTHTRTRTLTRARARTLCSCPPPPTRFAAPSHRMRSIFKQPISFNKLSHRFLTHLSASPPKRLESPAVGAAHERAFFLVSIKDPVSPPPLELIVFLQWGEERAKLALCLPPAAKRLSFSLLLWLCQRKRRQRDCFNCTAHCDITKCWCIYTAVCWYIRF